MNTQGGPDMTRDELRDRISDIITDELFERFGSPSSAVIGIQLAERILSIPKIAEGIGMVVVKEMK
jgi:hypothetical protein